MRLLGLAYLQFTPLPTGRWPDVDQLWQDLNYLHRLLGSPPEFPFRLIEIPIEATPTFRQLCKLEIGVPATEHLVREHLLNETLFEFGDRQIRTVG